MHMVLQLTEILATACTASDQRLRHHDVIMNVSQSFPTSLQGSGSHLAGHGPPKQACLLLGIGDFFVQCSTENLLPRSSTHSTVLIRTE